MVGRLPGIARQVMEGRRATKWTASPSLLGTDVEQYPYFAFAVLDVFRGFVQDTARACEQKCIGKDKRRQFFLKTLF